MKVISETIQPYRCIISLNYKDENFKFIIDNIALLGGFFLYKNIDEDEIVNIIGDIKEGIPSGIIDGYLSNNSSDIILKNKNIGEGVIQYTFEISTLFYGRELIFECTKKGGIRISLSDHYPFKKTLSFYVNDEYLNNIKGLSYIIDDEAKVDLNMSRLNCEYKKNKLEFNVQ